MLKNLFQDPDVLARHKDAPFIEERERYLEHIANEGYAQTTLIGYARELYWVAKKFKCYEPITRGINPEEIREVADKFSAKQLHSGRVQYNKWSRRFFIQVTTGWFRFLECLNEPVKTPTWYSSMIEDFATFMECEQGFSPKTIHNKCWQAEQFLSWYEPQRDKISSIKIADVDNFFKTYGSERWSRSSIDCSASALRSFFRYAATRNWCYSQIAESIQGPSLFAQEGLPSGPSWEDVKRLIDSMNTERPYDIRDRVIIMFFSIYGLRSSEVSNLRLEDINWEQNQIRITRTKQRRSQIYPFISIVGNALIHYLQSVRPRCSKREVFLKLTAPIKPLSSCALYNAVSRRMVKLGIPTLNRGPHSLRHACATHLLSEELSLKEIGDHLGHRNLNNTRIYAKVDLSNLSKVATFNFGGIL